MRVQVTRRGGLAGVALAATLDTADLAAPAAERAEAALRDLPWGRPPVDPTGPDRFRYHLSTLEGGAERRVELGESEVPEGLRPLLSLLHDRGRLQPPSAT